MNRMPMNNATDSREPVVFSRLVHDIYAGRQFPDQQVETFRHIDKLFPTRAVSRGESVAPLNFSDTEFPELQIRSRGQTFDLYDYLSRNRVTGLLVLKDGEIRLEKYLLGNAQSTRWASMSVAKSISSTLVGAAIHEGLIGGLEDFLIDYLPQLRGSAYDGVTIRQLLQMSSGAQWNESPTDAASDHRKILDLQLARQPGAILRYMAGLTRVAEPGIRWNYSSGEPLVLGALLRAATALPLADYLSERIWSKMGAEADARWWLESPDGLEVAGGGICATLRDYGRFGLFIMNDGVIGGERILPEGWMAEAGSPRVLGGKHINYGFMWWPLPATTHPRNRGAFAARGLFGQYLMVHPQEKVVAVVWSARSKPVGAEAIADNDFFSALVEALA